MSFTVTVTERGEPSETLGFSQPEVTIGRVRGNDIVLRRPSVSKRHARLYLEGGRILIADLGSTNGTVVNGRRIAGPALLRPTDKVIVGDYVLEVSPAEPSADSDAVAETEDRSAFGPKSDSAGHVAVGRFNSKSGDRLTKQLAPTMSASESSVGDLVREAAENALRSARPVNDETLATLPISVAAEMVTHTVGPVVMRLASAGTDGDADPRRIPIAAGTPRFSTVHRAALTTLLDALPPDALPTSYPPPPAELGAFERAVRVALPAEGTADRDEIMGVLVEELCGLGPIAYYLDDPEVTEIRVNAWDAIWIRRRGAVARGKLTFGSPTSYGAVAARIARTASLRDPAGGLVLWADGTRMQLVMPPVAVGGPLLFAARGRPTHATLATLDETGVLPQAVGNALAFAAAHGGIVLVCAATEDDALPVARAIVTGTPSSCRVVAVGRGDPFAVGGRDHVSLELLEASVAATARRAAALGPDVLALSAIGADALCELVTDSDIACGAVAVLRARSAADALSRLAAAAARLRPEDPDSVRSRLAAAIDLVVGVRAVEGHVVVSEIRALEGIADGAIGSTPVFDRSADPDAPTLRATGHVPRLFTELGTAGVSFDLSVFAT